MSYVLLTGRVENTTQRRTTFEPFGQYNPVPQRAKAQGSGLSVRPFKDDSGLLESVLSSLGDLRYRIRNPHGSESSRSPRRALVVHNGPGSFGVSDIRSCSTQPAGGSKPSWPSPWQNGCFSWAGSFPQRAPSAKAMVTSARPRYILSLKICGLVGLAAILSLIEADSSVRLAGPIKTGRLTSAVLLEPSCWRCLMSASLAR